MCDLELNEDLVEGMCTSMMKLSLALLMMNRRKARTMEGIAKRCDINEETPTTSAMCCCCFCCCC